MFKLSSACDNLFICLCVTRKVSLKLLTHLQENPEGTVAAYNVTRKFSFKSLSASALVIRRAGNVTFSNFLFSS